MWNPVKELKETKVVFQTAGDDEDVESGEGIESRYLDPDRKGSSFPWNPVKELKG